MFYKKYKFPVNLCIILEKNNFILYTSEVLTPNHYMLFTEKQWYFLTNVILRNELYYNLSTLIDSSALDTKYYSNVFTELSSLLSTNSLLTYNLYYMYVNKISLSLFYYYSLASNSKLPSIDTCFKNANWIESETSEMFSINYFNKTDTRVLLLDYPKNEFPLLKDFPTESWSELYYDFLDKNLHYSETIEHTEL